MTFEEFIGECKVGGIDKARQLLRQYVLDGQPDGFCAGATSRAMCREASNAITGEECETYFATTHGSELYFYMWSGEEI